MDTSKQTQVSLVLFTVVTKLLMQDQLELTIFSPVVVLACLISMRIQIQTRYYRILMASKRKYSVKCKKAKRYICVLRYIPRFSWLSDKFTF